METYHTDLSLFFLRLITVLASLIKIMKLKMKEVLKAQDKRF